jgi:hypothetical protein
MKYLALLLAMNFAHCSRLVAYATLRNVKGQEPCYNQLHVKPTIPVRAFLVRQSSQGMAAMSSGELVCSLWIIGMVDRAATRREVRDHGTQMPDLASCLYWQLHAPGN